MSTSDVEEVEVIFFFFIQGTSPEHHYETSDPPTVCYGIKCEQTHSVDVHRVQQRAYVEL